ncbi:MULTISPECIES: hypothetical protein [Pseudomonas]|uniref:hypothetical protein n=1 Tax=Pseudomonas TaxID=286 RepID=UPI00048F90CF|nr:MULTISPECIES: hypothetical protein [Pseudomonas]KAB0525672.1 hypothetical protein F7R16_27945 [Pseudomonas chlororaphis subsp. aureofaciens]QQX59174.1 hypothetical protein JHW28_01120 [Pseudomonas chlororaphis subsp. aurantiaca]TSD30139.1 hypothetical protein FCE86_011355 [Pseudomonas sp. ATCC 13985]WDG60756.1 hypothetical protein PUP52_02180 [Pseudomonas chlororaphis]WDG66966.1 hypothetical protein PUP59_02180 [Pseudomonas chlororaphis]
MTRYMLYPLFLLSILLTGCATKLDVALNGTPDPDYPFDRQAPVLVTVTTGNDESSLNARYYLRDMVNAMKDQGFREVFTEATLPKKHAPIKMTVTLDIESKRVTYRYTATEYGQVPTSTSTVCKDGKKKDKLVCTSTPNTSYGPVGTSERTGYARLTTFTVTARDEASRRAVYLLRVSSQNDDCQDAKVEAFVVEQGLQNLDFRDRVQRNYTVTMPDGYSCK